MNSDNVNHIERDMSGLLLSETQLGLPGHLGGIRLLEFTTDSRRFLSADLEMCVRVFEGEEEISSFCLISSNAKTRGQDRIHDAVFDSTGRYAYLAAGLHFRCLDVELGEELWSHRPVDLFGFLQTSPRAVGALQTGELFVCNDSGTMELWGPQGTLLKKRRAHDTPVMLARMNDGCHFVGSDGHGLTVWNPMTLRRTMRVKWTDVHVYGLAASPVAPVIAARTNGIVGIFNVETQELVSGIDVQPGLPILEFSPNGDSLLVGQGSGVVLFDLQGNELDRVGYMDDRVLSATFRPLTGEVYVGLASGAVEAIEIG